MQKSPDPPRAVRRACSSSRNVAVPSGRRRAVGAPPDGGPTPSSLLNAAVVTLQDPDASPPGANARCARPRPRTLVRSCSSTAPVFKWPATGATSPLAHGGRVLRLRAQLRRRPAPGSYAVGPIRDSAAELGGFVDQVLAATGASEVDIVGHSQGGMMPRWYLKFLGGADEVHTLIGISPSNHGTDLLASRR